MSCPRVTLGLPVRNGERHLPATLESLLGQSFGDFELIISDNASNDGTQDICRSYALRDSRVRYVRQPRNLGANENYDVLVQLAKGDLFKWSAHDDLCAPSYLTACVAALDRHPEVVLAHAEPLLIGDDGRQLAMAGGCLVQHDGTVVRPPDPPVRERGLSAPSPPERFAAAVLRTTWVFEVFGVIRLEVLRRTALQERFYGTDKVLVAELALHGPFYGVDEPLFHRRCHGGTTTNLRAADRIRWSDPAAPLVLPSLQMMDGYARAVRRAPLTPTERRACYAVLLRKAATVRKRTLLSDVRSITTARLAERRA